MKNLRNYINEGLLSRKISAKAPIRYTPHKLYELRDIIIELLEKGQTNLNCIDVSGITSMQFLFSAVNDTVDVGNIDISEWDVSNVTDMYGMFYFCEKFNSDLSKWNVRNVQNMSVMFMNCKEFDSDISKWQLNNKVNTECMLVNCQKFNSNISSWPLNEQSIFGCDSLSKQNTPKTVKR